MKNFKYAFTMIELVFVIVILGILSAVAIPKLSGVTRDAHLSQAMATVSSVRAAIASERQRTLIKGNANYPDFLDDAAKATENAELFDGNGTASTDVHILQYPIYATKDTADKRESGKWAKTTSNDENSDDLTKYKYFLSPSEGVEFIYNKKSGNFDCDHTTDLCKEVLN